jgi:hypothetical protein
LAPHMETLDSTRADGMGVHRVCIDEVSSVS